MTCRFARWSADCSDAALRSLTATWVRRRSFSPSSVRPRWLSDFSCPSSCSLRGDTPEAKRYWFRPPEGLRWALLRPLVGRT